MKMFLGLCALSLYPLNILNLGSSTDESLLDIISVIPASTAKVISQHKYTHTCNSNWPLELPKPLDPKLGIYTKHQSFYELFRALVSCLKGKIKIFKHSKNDKNGELNSVENRFKSETSVVGAKSCYQVGYKSSQDYSFSWVTDSALLGDAVNILANLHVW